MNNCFSKCWMSKIKKLYLHINRESLLFLFYFVTSLACLTIGLSCVIYFLGLKLIKLILKINLKSPLLSKLPGNSKKTEGREYFNNSKTQIVIYSEVCRAVLSESLVRLPKLSSLSIQNKSFPLQKALWGGISHWMLQLPFCVLTVWKLVTWFSKAGARKRFASLQQCHCVWFICTAVDWVICVLIIPG